MRTVILDTDFSTDVGDAICLSLAAAMHKLGMIDLLGVVVSSSNEKAAGAVSAVLQSFGLYIPIGQWAGAGRDSGGPGTWVGPLYDVFPRYVNLRASAEDARALYQRLLKGRAGVDIVALGGATSIDDLLTASPELVASSVGEMSWMVGDTPSSVSEFNIAFDQSAAGRVMSNWPTRIVYQGYTIGNGMISAGNLRNVFTASDPTYYAMTQHGSSYGRDSWDCLPLLWTVYREALFGLRWGSNVASGNGNTFVESTAGKDAYVTRSFSNRVYVHVQNALLQLARSASSVTTWPTGFAVLAPS